jgi:hypothetical protein
VLEQEEAAADGTDQGGVDAEGNADVFFIMRNVLSIAKYASGLSLTVVATLAMPCQP